MRWPCLGALWREIKSANRHRCACVWVSELEHKNLTATMKYPSQSACRNKRAECAHAHGPSVGCADRVVICVCCFAFLRVRRRVLCTLPLPTVAVAHNKIVSTGTIYYVHHHLHQQQCNSNSTTTTNQPPQWPSTLRIHARARS